MINNRLNPDTKALLETENALFEADYAQHYVAGQTKDKHIGRPFLLHHDDHKKGILLIHGLMAAPYEVRQWADFLYLQGYNVYAPRLAGHGTCVEDLAVRTKDEWLASAQRGHELLKTCCSDIAIAGFSTGAALALNLAVKNPEQFSSIMSISAPLKFKKFSAHFAGTVNNWNKLLNRLSIETARKEYVTNHADNPHINYGRCPVSSIVQIQRLMKEVKGGLGKIHKPCLIMHATDDPKVDVQSSRDIYRRLQTDHKTYQEVEFDLHGIINGNVAKVVFAQSLLFLQGEYC